MGESSRLVPHGQYYDNEKLGPLLDCLKEAFKRRGLPEKLYTDQGKIFTCAHLQVVCANLKIKLLHARPYAAWSKGKIEKFFQTVQRDFQERLRLEPVWNLEGLNTRFWHWLESEYHRRAHSASATLVPNRIGIRALKSSPAVYNSCAKSAPAVCSTAQTESAKVISAAALPTSCPKNDTKSWYSA